MNCLNEQLINVRANLSKSNRMLDKFIVQFVSFIEFLHLRNPKT